MSNSGSEHNEAFWRPDHGNPQQQQQFITSDGSIPQPSSGHFFHSNANYPSPGDKFTVLSDGLGNYIQVYHKSVPSSTEEVGLPVPGKYDLFSNNNSFMRSAPGFGYLYHQQTGQQTQPTTATMPTNAPPQQQQSNPIETGGNNTSMLINQLVGNWAPTISGTYSPFGGGGSSLLSEGLLRSSDLFVQPQQQPAPVNQPLPLQPQQSPAREAPMQPTATNSRSSNAVNVVPQLQQPQHLNAAQAPVTVSATAVYNQLNDDNSAKLNQNVKKQRIVAEVKPMRMSYSDVLSKNVTPSANSNTPGSNGGTASNNAGNFASKTNTATMVHNGNNGHGTSGGKSKGDRAKKASQLPSSGSGSLEEKVCKKADRSVANGQKKLSPTSNANNVASANQTHGDNLNSSRPIGTALNGTEKMAKKIDKTTGKIGKGRQSNDSVGNNAVGKKTRSSQFNDAYAVQDVQNSHAMSKKSFQQDTDEVEDDDNDDDEEGEDEDDDDDEDYDDYDDHSQNQSQPFMYNVKKNNNPNDTHIEKISAPRAAAYKRGSRSTGVTRGKPEKTPVGKRGQRPRRNQKYEFVEKIVKAWIELMLFAINWLWSLVSDVVYLSVRLCWDYLVAIYQYCEQHFVNLKQELQQNRPGAWFKSVWQSFDNRFAKDSKWAFWRGKRKSSPSEEQATTGKNYYKDGRLPSTADEAMSSLLNCKGKDAYSILGVSPDCSQEQIRKHYKKIAVLVHPDKNKQPGAEEAFKVLQRSFELIGEPEIRKSYDQSLAEALNAEKAWSEINDLLTQLHTKISEAANTIRCSSCCLRHPRKPTGRPHYAARECNSCKIRHSAREGDIWAETSFFGLRWKYLAMMEGNVYDITEWANCQKGALSHLQPNSHIVQYRIVLGGNSQQQQQQGNQQSNEKDASRVRKDAPPGEPNLDDFLNNIYGGQNQQQQQSQAGSRRRHRRN